MQITLSDSGKRFNRDWIFRNINQTFYAEKSYAIVGNNGSGKSTLLQSIAGILQLNQGKILWSNQQKEISPENIYKNFSIVAPYLELVEEMTALEFLHFHSKFKPFFPNITVPQILDEVELPDSAYNKQIRYFSSGMKQRIKLAQAIFSNVPVLLLDEPCTNLDKNGFSLYHRLIDTYCKEKIIIISSNDDGEYNFCTDLINIQDYKS